MRVKDWIRRGIPFAPTTLDSRATLGLVTHFAAAEDQAAGQRSCMTFQGATDLEGVVQGIPLKAP